MQQVRELGLAEELCRCWADVVPELLDLPVFHPRLELTFLCELS